MGHHFLRGLLPRFRRLLLLLRPPALRAGPRTLSLEPSPPSKRACGSRMAPPRIGTHNGTFHCDEALACALLRLLPEYRVRPAESASGVGRAPVLPLTSPVPRRTQRSCGPGTPKNWLPVTSW